MLDSFCQPLKGKSRVKQPQHEVTAKRLIFISEQKSVLVWFSPDFYWW